MVDDTRERAADDPRLTCEWEDLVPSVAPCFEAVACFDDVVVRELAIIYEERDDKPRVRV
jgi:hypothetical protein